MSNTADSKKRQNTMTPANIVTMIRICLVPVFLAAMLSNWPEWLGMPDVSNGTQGIVAAIIFIIISCTDWLDGYLARSRDEVTDFGKFMDPLADKILVAAALIALVELGALPTWVVVLILAREFIVSGLRMMAAAKGEVIAASYIGKFKTVFQMIAIVLFTIRDSQIVLDLGPIVQDNIVWFSDMIMGIALILTIVSMMDYLIKARDIIGLTRKPDHKCDDRKQNVEPADTSADTARKLSCQIIDAAAKRNITIASAESLTGGMAGELLTSVSGASAVYKGGITSYVNDIKNRLLNVDATILDTYGAVSEQCALEMACGARELLESDVAVSMTGIAGPESDESGQPVGTVWIGISSQYQTSARLFNFVGSRDEIRQNAVIEALSMLLAAIE